MRFPFLQNYKVLKRTARTKALWKVFLLEVKRHRRCPSIHTVLMLWFVFFPLQWIMGSFYAMAEAGWSRWIQGQSPTWRAALVLSNYLRENTSYVFSLVWGILAKLIIRWPRHNAAALIVRTPGWEAREICHRFSLSSKQCSGKAGLEKILDVKASWKQLVCPSLSRTSEM